jgi:hypothetical protein
MAWVDRQGRLWGRISVIDLAALGTVAAVLVGLVVVPGTGGSLAQVGGTQPVEVEVMVRGLSVTRPEALIKAGDKASFIIRNQPAGEVTLKQVVLVPRQFGVPQPDGSVRYLPDTRLQETVSRDFILTLAGRGQVIDGAIVVANNKIKVGVPVELEGPQYTMRGSVMDMRVGS